MRQVVVGFAMAVAHAGFAMAARDNRPLELQGLFNDLEDYKWKRSEASRYCLSVLTRSASVVSPL